MSPFNNKQFSKIVDTDSYRGAQISKLESLRTRAPILSLQKANHSTIPLDMMLLNPIRQHQL
jgi:hypothetical protein